MTLLYFTHGNNLLISPDRVAKRYASPRQTKKIRPGGCSPPGRIRMLLTGILCLLLFIAVQFNKTLRRLRSAGHAQFFVSPAEKIFDSVDGNTQLSGNLRV